MQFPPKVHAFLNPLPPTTCHSPTILRHNPTPETHQPGLQDTLVFSPHGVSSAYSFVDTGRLMLSQIFHYIPSEFVITGHQGTNHIMILSDTKLEGHNFNSSVSSIPPWKVSVSLTIHLPQVGIGLKMWIKFQDMCSIQQPRRHALNQQIYNNMCACSLYTQVIYKLTQT